MSLQTIEIHQLEPTLPVAEKQLVKFFYANGCRDIEDQLEFVQEFSQSQHLLFWLRNYTSKIF